MAEPVTVTPELLRKAWQQRRRHDWPACFDDAMADPMLSRLLRVEALRLALAARRSAGRTPRPVPAATSTTTFPSAAATAPPSRGIDRKRAASGERDDD